MQIVNVLKDAANNVFALTKVVVGLALDGTVNGLAAFVFKDKDGNAVFPQLNNEGAIVVSQDAGTTKRVSGKLLAAAQTKDVESQVIEIDLALEKSYTKMSAKVNNFRAAIFRMVYVDDAGVSDTETDLGYGMTEAGQVSDFIKLDIDTFSTVGGTGVQKLRLYATPLDTKDPDSDIYASMSCNEIA